MAKKGMSVEEIENNISHLKDANEKVQYLTSLSDRKHEGIVYPGEQKQAYKTSEKDMRRSKKKYLLKPETRKAINGLLNKYYLEAAEDFAEKGDGYAAAIYYRNADIKDKETLIKAANKLSKAKSYGSAAEFYEKAGKKTDAKIAYMKAGDAFVPTHYTDNALHFYEKSGMTKEEANKRIEKVNEELKANKTIESLVTSILAFGGLGTIFSLFSKPKVISPQNVQLAPPIPNYTAYVFAAMLIVGIGYFVTKKLLKNNS